MGGGQPESQSMQARLWEGHPIKPEGWENTIYATYAGAAVVITLALGFSPDTSINSVRHSKTVVILRFLWLIS